MTDEDDKPQKGDRYASHTLVMEVTRVAKDGSWADIKVWQPHTGASWTKRQPTPIPGMKQ